MAATRSIHVKETWTPAKRTDAGEEVWERDAHVAKLTMAEARAYERFQAHPHPNLGTYLGCVVHEGLLVCHAFPK